MIGPRWYCPPGVPRPAHVPHVAPVGLLDGVGPPGMPGGGMCYGGAFDRDAPGWHTVGAHAVNLAAATPTHLLRPDRDPALGQWVSAQGSKPGHVWSIPRLWAPQHDDAGEVISYRPLLLRTWSPTGWQAPEHLATLASRLLQIMSEIAQSRLTLADAEVVAVVCDLMSLGHHIDAAEIAACGWLDEAVLIRVLTAAGGIPENEHAHRP